MGLFEQCFGDLPEKDQKRLKVILSQMIDVIIAELRNKPFITAPPCPYCELTLKLDPLNGAKS